MTIEGCQENIKTLRQNYIKNIYEKGGEAIKCSRQINCVEMFYYSLDPH